MSTDSDMASLAGSDEEYSESEESDSGDEVDYFDEYKVVFSLDRIVRASTARSGRQFLEQLDGTAKCTVPRLPAKILTEPPIQVPLELAIKFVDKGRGSERFGFDNDPAVTDEFIKQKRLLMIYIVLAGLPIAFSNYDAFDKFFVQEDFNELQAFAYQVLGLFLVLLALSFVTVGEKFLRIFIVLGKIFFWGLFFNWGYYMGVAFLCKMDDYMVEVSEPYHEIPDDVDELYMNGLGLNLGMSTSHLSEQKILENTVCFVEF